MAMLVLFENFDNLHFDDNIEDVILDDSDFDSSLYCGNLMIAQILNFILPDNDPIITCQAHVIAVH